MRAESRTLAILPPRGRSNESSTRSLIDGLSRRSLLALFDQVTRGSLALVDGDERFTFGRPGDELSATVTVHDPAAYRAILFGGSVGAGEAYMKGHWTCDDLPALARILTRNLDALDAMDSGAARLSRTCGRWLLRCCRTASRSAPLPCPCTT